jgi:hypothetical protein
MRPAASGKPATCAPYLRATASPRAALVVWGAIDLPDDWPAASGDEASDARLGHALGWVCEVRPDGIMLLNPLGEGTVRAALPQLPDEWLHEVSATNSTAIYLLAHDQGANDEPDLASTVDAAARRAPVRAASVRTAISESYGKAPTVGRNAPCPCGSGRKYKHCHGT